MNQAMAGELERLGREVERGQDPAARHARDLKAPGGMVHSVNILVEELVRPPARCRA